MKKFLFLLLAIMPLALVSCHDENDLPDVDFTVTVTGGTYVNGSIYVVQGENLVINSILVHNKENGKAAMINSAAYYWDGYYLGTAIQPPFGFEIETTEETPLGKHSLEIVSPLLAVDKEIATSVLVYNVTIVGSADDIPAGGTNTFIGIPTVSDNSH